jgi:medium-chain acyl-[acyl-carrier-protein] hydrolase
MQSKSYNPSWREKFQVRSYDIGLNAMMRMSSVCSYFQEVAGRHANHLNLGYHYMQQSAKAWVLSRLFIKIDKMPAWGQDFFAETWPLGNERIFYRRDYRIDDGQDTMILATSYWILLDLKTRRPTVIPLDEDVLKTNAGRFAMPVPSDSFQAVSSDTAETHNVKYSDLDQNRHVNNARYVEWIFDLLDQEMLEEKAPAFFSIEYKHEVKAGDCVELRKETIENEPLTFAVEGTLLGSNQVCVRSKIVF